jgi:hypothetical protein
MSCLSSNSKIKGKPSSSDIYVPDENLLQVRILANWNKSCAIELPFNHVIYTALASAVLPSPPNPTTETILCCADLPSSFVNLIISSFLALLYRAAMRGSTEVL